MQVIQEKYKQNIKMIEQLEHLVQRSHFQVLLINCPFEYINFQVDESMNEFSLFYMVQAQRKMMSLVNEIERERKKNALQVYIDLVIIYIN